MNTYQTLEGVVSISVTVPDGVGHQNIAVYFIFGYKTFINKDVHFEVTAES